MQKSNLNPIEIECLEYFRHVGDIRQVAADMNKSIIVVNSYIDKAISNFAFKKRNLAISLDNSKEFFSLPKF